MIVSDVVTMKMSRIQKLVGRIVSVERLVCETALNNLLGGKLEKSASGYSPWAPVAHNIEIVLSISSYYDAEVTLPLRLFVELFLRIFLNNKKLSKKYEFCKLPLTSELCCLYHWKSILVKSCSSERCAYNFSKRLRISGLVLITEKPLSRSFLVMKDRVQIFWNAGF